MLLFQINKYRESYSEECLLVPNSTYPPLTTIVEKIPLVVKSDPEWIAYPHSSKYLILKEMYKAIFPIMVVNGGQLLFGY